MGVMSDRAADGLLPIGMFSRASGLSIKTLRAYHEGSILVPASVDARTGYRAYTVDQLADAAVIVRLRALDVPLEHVRSVLARRDPAHTATVLAAHADTMARRLAETERIVAELQSDAAPVTHTPVHVRREPAQHTLRIAGTVPIAELPDFLGRAYDRLAAVLAAAGVAPAGPAGALYGAELADDDIEDVEAFFPVAAPVAPPRGERDCTMGEVPAATVAVLVHTGGYETMGETYRALGAWVARHAGHAGGRVREWYLVGPGDVDTPAGYRTELSWPIDPEA